MRQGKDDPSSIASGRVWVLNLGPNFAMAQQGLLGVKPLRQSSPSGLGLLGLRFDQRHIVHLALPVVGRPFAGLLTLFIVPGAQPDPVLPEPLPIAGLLAAVVLRKARQAVR
jgi:hypothetical protein